jgi:hypothetical protein
MITVSWELSGDGVIRINEKTGEDRNGNSFLDLVNVINRKTLTNQDKIDSAAYYLDTFISDTEIFRDITITRNTGSLYITGIANG